MTPPETQTAEAEVQRRLEESRETARILPRLEQQARGGGTGAIGGPVPAGFEFVRDMEKARQSEIAKQEAMKVYLKAQKAIHDAEKKARSPNWTVDRGALDKARTDAEKYGEWLLTVTDPKVAPFVTVGKADTGGYTTTVDLALATQQGVDTTKLERLGYSPRAIGEAQAFGAERQQWLKDLPRRYQELKPYRKNGGVDLVAAIKAGKIDLLKTAGFDPMDIVDAQIRAGDITVREWARERLKGYVDQDGDLALRAAIRAGFGATLIRLGGYDISNAEYRKAKAALEQPVAQQVKSSESQKTLAALETEFLKYAEDQRVHDLIVRSALKQRETPYSELSDSEQRKVLRFFAQMKVASESMGDEKGRARLPAFALAAAPVVSASPVPVDDAVLWAIVAVSLGLTSYAAIKAGVPEKVSQALDAFRVQHDRSPTTDDTLTVGKQEIPLGVAVKLLPPASAGIGTSISPIVPPMPSPYTRGALMTPKTARLPIGGKTGSLLMSPSKVAPVYPTGGILPDDRVPPMPKGESGLLPSPLSPGISGAGFVAAVSTAVETIPMSATELAALMGDRPRAGTDPRASVQAILDAYEAEMVARHAQLPRAYISRGRQEALEKAAILREAWSSFIESLRPEGIRSKKDQKVVATLAWLAYQYALTSIIQDATTKARAAYNEAMAEGQTVAAARSAAQTAAQQAVKANTDAAVRQAVQTAVQQAVQVKVSTAVQQAVRTATQTAVRNATQVMTATASAMATTAATATAAQTATGTATQVATKEATRSTTTTTTALKMPPPESDQGKRLLIRKSPGAVAWQMGKLHGKRVWHTRIPPYGNEQHIVVLGRRPQGAKIADGPGSAYRTATLLYGKPPPGDFTQVHGAITARLVPTDKGVRIRFSPTTPRISRPMPRISRPRPRISR